MVIAGVVALIFSIGLIPRTVGLATRGVVAQAEVVEVRPGGKGGEDATVHLPSPINRTADVIEVDGLLGLGLAPSPGATILVRYDPRSPNTVVSASEWPWTTVSLSFGFTVLAFATVWLRMRHAR